MVAEELDGSRAAKRPKLDLDSTAHSAAGLSDAEATDDEIPTTGTAIEHDATDDELPNVEETETTNASLSRPISPPPARRKRSVTPSPSVSRSLASNMKPTIAASGKDAEKSESIRYVPSPTQLTRIRDLSQAQNVDTVGLKDILGDPMIKETWQFNYLFDVDFVMQHLDPDVRDMVKVHIVHGFWRKEDCNREVLMEATERYPNLTLHSAYMPDPFGTHHSKMMVLLRHDDMAQVVIHTANMIDRDWRNMTQAMWRSPLLPLRSSMSPTPSSSRTGSQETTSIHPLGSGERFKIDLLRYVSAYGNRLNGLAKQLVQYDFSSIRAAFIGSTPSRQKPKETQPDRQTSWGWLGLQEILSSIPIQPAADQNSPPNLVIQISSIATLGQTPTWLTHFQTVLSSSSAALSRSTLPHNRPSAAFFAKRAPRAKPYPPTFNIIFPTAHEIRTSLDGYASGASIHTKLQSAAQQKQLLYLHPLLCHWKHFSSSPSSSNIIAKDKEEEKERRKAERGYAAPHIKTYIRFSTAERTSIDWAMVTSANLSTQAWGAATNKDGEMRIQSWETGVVVWPSLFSEAPNSPNDDAIMVPVFIKDAPGPLDLPPSVAEDEKEKSSRVEGDKGKTSRKRVKTVVGFRMPYDLPLERYKTDEVPWCATADHEEPDWMGAVYKGFTRG